MSALWKKDDDDRNLEVEALHDAEVPEELDIHLASFRPNLHWAIVWKAFKRDVNGDIEQAGWKVLEVRHQVTNSEELKLRFHFKPSDSQTSASWKTKILGRLDGEGRVAIVGWASARADVERQGNCITCVCDVIKDMALTEGLLPPTAVDALNEQKAEDIEESTIFSDIHNAGNTGRLWSLSSPRTPSPAA
jgi:hypothetical protein